MYVNWKVMVYRNFTLEFLYKKYFKANNILFYRYRDVKKYTVELEVKEIKTFEENMYENV